MGEHLRDAGKNRRARAARKFQALLALGPLGAFLTGHLVVQASALISERTFRSLSSQLAALPGATALEVFGVWLPLAVHSGFGLWAALFPPREAEGKPGGLLAEERSSVRVRSVSGAAALAFLTYHVLEFRVPRALGQLASEDLSNALYARLSSTSASGLPLIAGLYVVGVSAVVFHFCYSGYVWYVRERAPASRRPARVWFSVLGAVLLALGIQTVVYRATGSRLLFFA